MLTTLVVETQRPNYKTGVTDYALGRSKSRNDYLNVHFMLRSSILWNRPRRYTGKSWVDLKKTFNSIKANYIKESGAGTILSVWHIAYIKHISGIHYKKIYKKTKSKRLGTYL